ncbi:RcpC/CpaB family pilus assembly protein [Paenibacillus enshidis]|uniref:RcpC/CpaB family pilus assembly protein n=1 Tax=Paenibacillus enshidis TaxID=1458439 RepID=A0ABV5AVB3_9BACL
MKKSNLALKKLWNKNTYRVTVVGLALIVSFAIVLVATQYVSSNTEVVEVVVAKENIDPNKEITDLVEMGSMVKSQVPEDAVYGLDELSGSKYYAGSIGFYKGQALQKSGITTSDKSSYGSALELEESQRLVAVKVDQSSSTGGMVKPGVIVDAVVYLKGDGGSSTVIGSDEDPDLANLLVVGRENSEGTSPGEDGRSSLTTIVIVKAPSVEVYKKLVKYQEDGKVYLAPAGVKGSK